MLGRWGRAALLLALLALATAPGSALAASATSLHGPRAARVGERVRIRARGLGRPRRYVVRLVIAVNPRGESTICQGDVSRPRLVGGTATFSGRIPTRLGCRLHGVGPLLGAIPVGPGRGYRFAVCAPRGLVCRADARFAQTPVRIVR